MDNLKKSNQKIPSDILDDLASRFIINIPVEERTNVIRLCFQIELAHWFYIDFICKNKSDLTVCGNKVFALQLFQHIPFLREHVPKIDNIFEEWKQYKLSVPTYGAIILSEDLQDVLLVQSFYAKSSWGFPKGKVNENELPVLCAIREVLEETGFNISNLIDPNEYIESIVNDQFTRLYIVTNVPKSTQFQPRTRNEIKSCEWFPVDFLPVTRYDNNPKNNLGMNSNSFFMITPFVKRLKKWINERRIKMNSNSAPIRQRHHSTGDLEALKRGSNIKGNGTSNGRGGGSTNQNNVSRSTSKTGRTSTDTTLTVFTNSKINQFSSITPQGNFLNNHKSSKVNSQRKLFNENEKENNSQKKFINENKKFKNKIKFPSEDSLSKWKNFSFDLEKILPKF